jgi:hypothetical protein
MVRHNRHNSASIEGNTHPSKQGKKRHVAIAGAGRSDAQSGNDDEDELNAIKASPAIFVGEVAKEQLTAHRPCFQKDAC